MIDRIVLNYAARVLRLEAKVSYFIKQMLTVYKKMTVDFGYAQSLLRNECVDADGSPIPWLTYPCIEYLKQLDLRDKSVFEWGSGNSTLFWAARCKDVTSVEHGEAYYQKTQPRFRQEGNINRELQTDLTKYVQAIATYNEKFDIIVVDGERRLDCAQQAVKHVKDDGIIILDNSEWYWKSAQYLRDHTHLQVDFSGFLPLWSHTEVTSIFFTKDAKFNSLAAKQPIWPIGGSKKYRE